MEFELLLLGFVFRGGGRASLDGCPIFFRADVYCKLHFGPFAEVEPGQALKLLVPNVGYVFGAVFHVCCVIAWL